MRKDLVAGAFARTVGQPDVVLLRRPIDAGNALWDTYFS
jgi:hypothetical protein